MDLEFEDNVMETFKVATQIRQHTERITGIDFCPDGTKLISGSTDETVIIYDCVHGTVDSPIYSKKYGVGIIKFGSTLDEVVYTSTKVNHDIRYLSLSRNKYLRYFSGHSKSVVSLSSTSNREIFISCSADMTLKLWDPRTPQFVGNMNLAGSSIASFHPLGGSFALGVNSEVVEFHDMRSFGRGPFRTFDKILKSCSSWTDLKYSRDGNTLLINSAGFIQTRDVVSGALVQAFSDHVNSTGVPIEASFTPDGKYVVSGSTNGLVHIWNAETAMPVVVLNPDRVGSIACLQFNPRFKIFVTASNNVISFWLPMQKGDIW